MITFIYTCSTFVYRIHTEINGGAWCPKEHISKNVVEFLEINFEQLKVITLIETQGRFGNGQVRIWSQFIHTNIVAVLTYAFILMGVVCFF